MIHKYDLIFKFYLRSNAGGNKRDISLRFLKLLILPHSVVDVHVDGDTFSLFKACFDKLFY